MSEKPEKLAVEKRSKRGIRYATNPFVDAAMAETKSGVRRITNKSGDQMLVVNEATGEIMAPAGFHQIQEVDKSQFVKLFINGVKALKELTASGTKVFEILYREVAGKIGQDTIWLDYHSIDQLVTPMSEPTFYRGMKELLEKGFIAETLSPGRYYLNLTYLWNGDRLAFIREFRVVTGKTSKNLTAALEAAGQQRLELEL